MAALQVREPPLYPLYPSLICLYAVVDRETTKLASLSASALLPSCTLLPSVLRTSRPSPSLSVVLSKSSTSTGCRVWATLTGFEGAYPRFSSSSSLFRVQRY